MRLYHEGEWYDPLTPGATFEGEFEGMILSHSSKLFPDFHCFRFDPLFATPFGDVKPDLALIDLEYRAWFIVEVELATHSVTRHVKPQMERIFTARPTEQHAEWLADRHPELDRSRLRQLVRDVPHGTVLVTNAPTPTWDDALASLGGVQRAIVEVYRNRLSRTILRVNGQQPQGPGDLVTHLRQGSGQLSAAYRVEVPSSLAGELVHIDADVGGTLYRYRIKTLGGEKYLFPSAGAPISPKPVRLLVDRASSYRIEE